MKKLKNFLNKTRTKTRLDFSVVSALTAFMLLLPSAHAATEWGNGERGFLNLLNPEIYMPLKKPLQITQVQCILFLKNMVRENQRKDDKSNSMEKIKIGYDPRSQRWTVIQKESFSRGVKTLATSSVGLGDLLERLERRESQVQSQIECSGVTGDFKSLQQLVSIPKLATAPSPAKGSFTDDYITHPYVISDENLAFAYQRVVQGSSEYIYPAGAQQSRMENLLSELHPAWDNTKFSISLSLIADKKERARVSSLVSRLGNIFAQGLLKDGQAPQICGNGCDFNIYSSSVYTFDRKSADPLSPISNSVTTHSRRNEFLLQGQEPSAQVLKLEFELSPEDHRVLRNLNTLLSGLPLRELGTYVSLIRDVHNRAQNKRNVDEIKAVLADLMKNSDKHIAVSFTAWWMENFVSLNRRRDENALQALNSKNGTGYGPQFSTDNLFYLETVPGLVEAEINELDKGFEKVKFLLARLNWVHPQPIEKFDPRGCKYVLDIASTVKTLHNKFFIYDEIPEESYNKPYMKKVTEVLSEFNKMRYQASERGAFLSEILPAWRDVCQQESPQIEQVLSEFR